MWKIIFTYVETFLVGDLCAANGGEREGEGKKIGLFLVQFAEK